MPYRQQPGKVKAREKSLTTFIQDTNIIRGGSQNMSGGGVENSDIGWQRGKGGSGKCWLWLTKGEGGSGYCWTHWQNGYKCRFSKHRPSGPMLSISRNVRLSVHVFVRLSVCSVLRYCLNVFLPPLPEVGCPIFLEIQNPLGKVMERSGLRFEHFCLKVV